MVYGKILDNFAEPRRDISLATSSLCQYMTDTKATSDVDI